MIWIIGGLIVWVIAIFLLARFCGVGGDDHA